MTNATKKMAILAVLGLAVLATAAEAADVPTVDNNGGASSIGTTNATLNGNLTSTGGVPTYVWVYWGASNGDTNKGGWANTNSLGQMPAGPFSTNISGLVQGLRYYYRSYASNSLGDAWASDTTDFYANGAGPGQTWDGGSAVNDNWSTGMNWVGDVVPGNPATSVVTL